MHKCSCFCHVFLMIFASCSASCTRHIAREFNLVGKKTSNNNAALSHMSHTIYATAKSLICPKNYRESYYKKKIFQKGSMNRDMLPPVQKYNGRHHHYCVSICTMHMKTICSLCHNCSFLLNQNQTWHFMSNSGPVSREANDAISVVSP